MARPRLGLFDQKFAQQPGYRVVDELAAVVGMKAANHKRELSEHRFEQWNQPKLRDLRRGGDNLPLRHFVDRVDVIRSEEHTSELQSLTNLVCRFLLEKKTQRFANQVSGSSPVHAPPGTQLSEEV